MLNIKLANIVVGAMFNAYRRDDVVYANLVNRYLRKKFEGLSKVELDFMSEVARADFLNYVMTQEDFLYEDNAERLALDAIIYYIEEEPFRIDALLSEWLDVWSWKWKQRVKLVLKEDPNLAKAEEMFNQRLGPVIPKVKNYEWFRKFAIGSLINIKEVCFTNLLSDSIVKGVLFKIAKSLPPEKTVQVIEKNPLFVLGEIVNRVKELKTFKGNLVVVRLNSSFFKDNKESLVEWW